LSRCLRAVSSDANCVPLGGRVSTSGARAAWRHGSPGDTLEEFKVYEVLVVHVRAGAVLPLERVLEAIWPDALVCFLPGHLARLYVFIDCVSILRR